MMLKKMQRPGWSYISRIIALPILVLTVAAFTVRTKALPVPMHLEKNITVVIDAGHGKINGHYSGASVDDVYEDAINLAIAKKIQEANQNPAIQIILTRNSDDNVDLHKRVEIANASKADLYISIHVNAAEPLTGSNGSKVVNEFSSGMEVLIPKEGHTFYNSSIVFGSSVVNHLKNIYPTDGQIKTNQVAFVLKQSPCPAALIEFGYLTNNKDRAFITNPENQEKLAAAVLASIEQYAIAADSEKPVMDTVPVSKEISSINVNKANNTITIEYTNGKTETLTMDEARKRDLIRKKEGEKVNAAVTNKPLYVVNGDIYYGDPDRIEPTSIQQIDVLKSETALKKYGQKGKYGAVEITLKKNSVIAPVNASITRIQQEAHIDPEAWKKFLESNLSPVLERLSKKAPEGKYTAKVKFMVNTNGSLADITVEDDPGYGIGEEVKSMMQFSPLWEPATEDGHPVNSYHTQPITLVVSK